MILLPGAAGRTAAEVVADLALEAHTEGGFFRETYRSPLWMDTSRGRRSLMTSILYLVDHDHPSRFHRLTGDEMWYFHDGVALEMVFLEPGQERPRRVLLDREHPQSLAPAGVWMAAHVIDPPGWALVGCVVTPGFEYDDFEKADPSQLLAEYPGQEALIRELT